MTRDNTNRGTLNHTREKRSERSPDFYGRLQISGDVLAALNEGKPIRLSGWTRSGQYGEFISLAAEVERPRQESASEAGAQHTAGNNRAYAWGEAEARAKEERQPIAAPTQEDFNDDIPF